MKPAIITARDAFAYLRSLDPGTVIELPGDHDPRPHDPAADAVSVITGSPARIFAQDWNRWTWIAGVLVSTLTDYLVDIALAHLDEDTP